MSPSPFRRKWRRWTSVRLHGRSLAIADMRPGLAIELRTTLEPGEYDLDVMHFGKPALAPIGRVRMLRKGADGGPGKTLGRVSVDGATIALCEMRRLLAAFDGNDEALGEWSANVDRTRADRGVCLVDRREGIGFPWFVPGEGDGVYDVRELVSDGRRVGIEITCLPDHYQDVVEVPVHRDLEFVLAVSRRDGPPIVFSVARSPEYVLAEQCHVEGFLDRIRDQFLDAVPLASCPALGPLRSVGLALRPFEGGKRTVRSYEGSVVERLSRRTISAVAARLGRWLRTALESSGLDEAEDPPRVDWWLTFSSGMRVKDQPAQGVVYVGDKLQVDTEGLATDLLFSLRPRVPLSQPLEKLVRGATRFSLVRATVRRSEDGSREHMKPERKLQLSPTIMAPLTSARTLTDVARWMKACYHAEMIARGG